MNTLQQFTSVCLGQIPTVGGFLSGVYDLLNPSDSNQVLLNRLTAIEDSIDRLQAQISELSVDISLQTLFGETHYAQFHIDGWYHSDVRAWLDGNCSAPLDATGFIKATGNDPSPTGVAIASDCANDLNDIHQAIMGNGEPDSSTNPDAWLNLIIQKLVAAADGDKQLTQSLLETTYQAFISLLHLQLRGVACLRAINSPVLGRYTGKVRSNIIQQGLLCQSLVAGYLSSEQFVWFGAPRSLSNSTMPTAFQVQEAESGEVRWLSTKAVAVPAATDEAVYACGGIEFGQPSQNSGNLGGGFKIASAKLRKDGSLHGSSWGSVVQSQADDFNLIPDTYWQGCVKFPLSQPVVVPPGHVVTGIQLQVDQLKPDEALRPPEMYDNHLYAQVFHSRVHPDGSLGPQEKITQNSAGSWSGNRLYYITDSPFSRASAHGAGSPITGFDLCGVADPTNGGLDQVGVKLQTSIHAQAFAPVPINSTPGVTIFCPAQSLFVTVAAGAVEAEPTESYADDQIFTLSGLSATPSYGDTVKITCSDGSGLVLKIKANTDGTGHHLEFGADDGTPTCHWELIDSDDVDPQHSESSAISAIYNLSAVAIRSADTTVTHRYLQAVAGTPPASATVGLGTAPTYTPSTTNETAIDETEGNQNRTYIFDSSFLWNLRPGVSENQS